MTTTEVYCRVLMHLRRDAFEAKDPRNEKALVLDVPPGCQLEDVPCVNMIPLVKIHELYSGRSGPEREYIQRYDPATQRLWIVLQGDDELTLVAVPRFAR